MLHVCSVFRLMVLRTSYVICDVLVLTHGTETPSESMCFQWIRSRGGGNSHTLPIRVCAAQRGRDFEAPDLERGIHFRGVY